MSRAPLLPPALLSFVCLGGMPAASATLPDTGPTELEAIQVSARVGGFRAPGPAATTKSDLPLEQTPLSIDVLGQALLDSQQVHDLGQALQNAGGVVGGVFGRRGWNDFIIRGQNASSSVFVDGLRSAATNRMTEQTFGYEQVEVLKGPASLLYGQVQPGGMVNLVSKRPLARAHARADLTVGSHGLRQLAADAGTPLGHGSAALRINALAMKGDDPTDHVWSRERFIAPALSLDVSEATDFVLLASYQQRRYIRQQGLPLRGTVLPSRYRPLRRSLFTGEPGQMPYDGDQWRAGWQFEHRFDNGWRLHNGLRWQSTRLDGEGTFNGVVQDDDHTLRRLARRQHWGGRTWVQDTYLSRDVGDAAFRQSLTLGLGAFRTWNWFANGFCKPTALDLRAPVYSGARCGDFRDSDDLSIVTAGGLYLRDSLHWGEDWQLLLGLRHDRSRTDNHDRRRGRLERNDHAANTGSAALMVQVLPGLRPYLSFATSFSPNAGVDAQGRSFAPERGRQWELGAKYALGEHALLTAALYDLERRNVPQADPRHPGVFEAIGGQRSRGGELGVQADLRAGYNLNASYAYTDAAISDDGGRRSGTVGARLPNVPLHTGSLWLRRDPDTGHAGFHWGAGLRAASQRLNAGYRLPGYLVVDAALGWRGAHWDIALNVRNLLGQDYFSGGLGFAAALGDPRTLSLRLRYDY